MAEESEEISITRQKLLDAKLQDEQLASESNDLSSPKQKILGAIAQDGVIGTNVTIVFMFYFQDLIKIIIFIFILSG